MIDSLASAPLFAGLSFARQFDKSLRKQNGLPSKSPAGGAVSKLGNAGSLAGISSLSSLAVGIVHPAASFRVNPAHSAFRFEPLRDNSRVAIRKLCDGPSRSARRESRVRVKSVFGVRFAVNGVIPIYPNKLPTVPKPSRGSRAASLVFSNLPANQGAITRLENR